MRILIATSNPHKLEEIRAVIVDASVELVTLDALPGEIDEPVEDKDTFEGNAILKARYYAKASGMMCLADDSGLEVDALNGEPGVRSARYSGADGPRAERDAANSLALLKNLGDTPVENRTARFVCAMALVDGRQESDEPLAVVRGTLEGRILTNQEADDPTHPERGRGANGFGYDPIVFIPDHNKTVAQLTPDEKNAISHRGDAVRKLWPHIYVSYSDHITYEAGAMSKTRELFRTFIRDFMDAATTDHARARNILKMYPKLRDTPVTLGETPLHYLAIEAHAEAVDFLAREGFDVNSKNEFGDPPLIDVASIGEVETARVLLRHGADPNAKSTTMDCALFCAIRSGKLELVELLLQHGALPNEVNDHGETVFDMAREAKRNQWEIEDALRKAGAHESGK